MTAFKEMAICMSTEILAFLLLSVFPPQGKANQHLVNIVFFSANIHMESLLVKHTSQET